MVEKRGVGEGDAVEWIGSRSGGCSARWREVVRRLAAESTFGCC